MLGSAVFFARTYSSYPVRKLRGGTFSFQGQSLPYFCHWYNYAHANERTIEVAIAKHFLQSASDVLEVGNVLNHYCPFRHEVVDKFEKAPGVINCDVREYQPQKDYDLILSVSTLEHVGWDERPKEKPEAFYDAVENLKRLLAPHGKLVATIPLGYNQWLDGEIAAGKLPFEQVVAYRRINRRNEWQEVKLTEIIGTAYGHPFGWANALVVGIGGR